MTTRSAIEEFLSQRTLAVVGVSRNPRKFGSAVFRELGAKGYKVLAVNPNAQAIDGQPCFASLRDLPETVGGAVIVVPRAATEQVVRDAAAAGIRRVWIQQRTETDAVLCFCAENGITTVHGQCILMFAPPVKSIHGFHRWLKGLFGGLPR